MPRFSSMAAIVAAAAALTFTAATAQAALIQFSAGGDSEPIALSNGTTGTVFLDAKSDSIDLTSGVPQVVQLNQASLDVIPASEAVAFDTLSQTLTIPGAPSQGLSQAVQVSTSSPGIFSPSQASATIASGVPAVFDLGEVGTLTVTPLGGTLEPTSTENPTFDNFAQFLLVAPIPEPTSGLLLLAGAGLMMARRRVGT